jgi:hypothetical protein
VRLRDEDGAENIHVRQASSNSTTRSDNCDRIGGTGYIGGSVLDALVKQHPEYDITALLRNVPKDFDKLYPNVHIVRGDFDSSDILTEAASKADIVIRKRRIAHAS